MLLLQGHAAPIWSLEYSPDGRLLASRDQAGQARVWDLARGQTLFTLGGDANAQGGAHSRHEGLYLEALAFVAADQVLAIDFQGQLRWWDLKTNRASAKGSQVGRVIRMAVSPNGTLVAFGREADWQPGVETGRLCLGNLSGGQATLTSWGCQHTVFCLRFSTRSNLLACGVGQWGRQGQVCLYQLAEQLQVKGWWWNASRWRWNDSQHGVLAGARGPVLSLAFSDDDRLLAAGCSDGTVQIWDVAERRLATVLQRHDDLVRGVAFAGDHRTLISVSWDGHVKVWNTLAGREKATFQWHAGMIHAIAFAPDGMTAATAGQDGNIIVWDVDLP